MISPELLEQGYKDCDALVLDYYAKTIASHGPMPLKIDWDTYRRLEREGHCVLFTAREQQLDGFSLYVVNRHLHHPTYNVAACSILGVRPEVRGQGLGRKLIEFAIPWLKTRGCTHIAHAFRMIYDEEPLFPKLGFKLVEQLYMRELP
jgi:GNAT superfamily N-acetyltransferase